ncbi:hypothetical protein Tco_0964441, partial [Tanacetum coccineum]
MLVSPMRIYFLLSQVKADVIEVPELLANVFDEDSDVVLCSTEWTSWLRG